MSVFVCRWARRLNQLCFALVMWHFRKRGAVFVSQVYPHIQQRGRPSGSAKKSCAGLVPASLTFTFAVVETFVSFLVDLLTTFIIAVTRLFE